MTWTEEKNGYPYEFIGRCDCKAGRSIDGLQPAAAHLSPFEMEEIKEVNRKREIEDVEKRRIEYERTKID